MMTIRKKPLNWDGKSNPYQNWHGPGKPITKEDLAAMMKDMGIEERFDANGIGYYRREDCEPAFKHFLDKRQN